MADLADKQLTRARGSGDKAGSGEEGSVWQALRRDVPSLLLALTLLLMPLYRTRVLEDSFNTPKLALAMVLGVLTAIGLLARAESSRMKLRWYPAPWLLVGLAVWQALSVLWADSKPLGVDGTVYFATFAVMGWLFYRGPRSVPAMIGLFWAGAAGAAVTAVWVLVDDFGRGMGSLVARLPDWRGYLAAGLGNSGHIAGMIGMFLPWVLMRFLWVGSARVGMTGGELRVRERPVDGGQEFEHEREHEQVNGARNWVEWLLLPVIGLMFAALAVTWSVGSAGATILSLVIWGIVAWRWLGVGGGTDEHRRTRTSTGGHGPAWTDTYEHGLTQTNRDVHGPERPGTESRGPAVITANTGTQESERMGGNLCGQSGAFSGRYGRPWVFSWRRIAAVVAVGLAVIGFYFTPNPLNPHKPTLWAEAFGSDRWEAGWPTRLVIWKTTWQMIEQNPMVGMGTGNFTFNYVQQVVPSVVNDPRLAPYSGAFTNDAHNDYLQLWAEGGVVSLALWMAALSTFYVTIAQLLPRLRDSDSAMLLIGAGAGMTVFALDGVMSFPMRLPAHFMMAMFFLSVPGVVRRLQAVHESGVALNAEAAQRAAVMQRRFGRRLRTGGVGILLTLAACVWHHGHRVVAEFYLKAGRSAADSAVLMMGGQPVPAWMACDAVYQQTLQAIASGAPSDVWREAVDQLRAMATVPGLNDARELFEKSQGVDRWYANASSRLGQLLLFQGEFGRSMEVTRRTLKTLQAYEVHERMGAAAFLDNRIPIAREHWTICLMRRPEQADFYRELLRQVTEHE